MSDYSLRQLERQYSATPSDVNVINQYINTLKRAGADPANAEAADRLLSHYMMQFDVPYVFFELDGVVTHRIPMFRSPDRRGLASIQFIDGPHPASDEGRDGLNISNIRARRLTSRFDEPQFISYRAPNQGFGELLRRIDTAVVPDHDEVAESIVPMIYHAAEEAGAGIKVLDHKRMEETWRTTPEYPNGKKHTHLFNLLYHRWPDTEYGGIRCSLMLRRLPHQDSFEFRINENINYGDGWQVLDLALSGTRYEEYGPGGWDVEEDEDDPDLHDEDTVLGPVAMQTQLNFYIDEMRNGLRIRD